MKTNLLITIFAVVALGCGPKRVATEMPAEAPALRVMTYNLNYGLAGEEQTLEAIGAGDADIVFVQETTPQWERAIRARYAKKFAYVEFEHSCGAGGLGVLSRVPVTDHGVLEPPDDGWFPAWYLEFDTALGKVQGLNVHLRPPVSDSGSFVSGYFSTRKVREAEIATYWAAIDPDKPVIVAGDFNENKNGRAVSFLRARGLESALPEFTPRAKTWRWTTSVGSVSSTLDHVVYDPTLVPVNAEVLDVGRSDHRPVVVTFARADG